MKLQSCRQHVSRLLEVQLQHRLLHNSVVIPSANPKPEYRRGLQ